MYMRTIRRGQGQWSVPTPTTFIDQFWSRFADETDPVMPAIGAAIERHANPSKVMIDIGAWIGPATLIGSMFYEAVVSVEPNPAAFRLLDIIVNSPDNGDLGRRVAPFQFAIGSDDGTIKMLPSVDCYPLAGLEHESCVLAQAITMARFMTLVDLHDKPIGLIKADLGTIHTLRRTAGSLIGSAIDHDCPIVLSVSHAHCIKYEFDALVGQIEKLVSSAGWNVSTSGDDWSNLIEVCPL